MSLTHELPKERPSAAQRILRRGILVELSPKDFAEGAPRSEIQIGIEGRWEDHPAGPFSLGRVDFEQVVRNFDRDTNDLVVDFEHQTINSLFNGEPAPAAGWAKALRVGDKDGSAALFAMVEWTDEAADLIRKRKYRYISPVFVFGATDRRTGENIGTYLHSIALTNTPFLDGMDPIELSRHKEASMSQPNHQASIETQAAPASAPVVAASIASALGLAPDETEDKALEAVRAIMRRATEGEAVTALRSELASAQKQIAALTKERHEARVTALTQEGKLLPAQRAWALSYLEKDPEGFEQFVAAAPVVGPVTQEVATPERRIASDVASRREAAVKKYQAEHSGSSYKDALTALSAIEPELFPETLRLHRKEE